MKKKSLVMIASACIMLTNCATNNSVAKNVVSERFVHKYGYDVPKSEWKEQNYPGQILTTMTDGKSVVASYEDGVLHGTKTETYPHSQTIHYLEQYERGTLVKKVRFNIRGVPEKERIYKTPTHHVVTRWYGTGSPRSREEIQEGILVNGEYYNLSNEIVSRIESGTGEKAVHNAYGDLLSKEVYNNFALTYIETYHPNGMPKTAASYENNKLHGERKEFAMSGEPLSVENFQAGERHGLCCYYQNGCKYLEVPYVHGIKHGIERAYIDGTVLASETNYQFGEKHGPSVVYIDGSAKTTWFYQNDKVSKNKFEELTKRLEIITRNTE